MQHGLVDQWRGRLGRLLVIVLACFGLMLTLDAKPLPDSLALAKPGDWPTFGGGPGRNMVNLLAKNLPLTWSLEEGQRRNIRWVIDAGPRTAMLGQPVIADGMVFVGTTNRKPNVLGQGNRAVLLAVRASDGQTQWNNSHDIPPNEIFNEIASLGLLSTPTVVHGFVFYVTPSCEVICAQGMNGRIQWRYDLMRELGVVPLYCNICSPLVVGDLVYVVTGNGVDATTGQVATPQAPSLVALQRTTGKLVWQATHPGGNIIEGQWSNPVFAKVGNQQQVILPGGDSWLYGLDAATGKLIWKFDCQPERPARGQGDVLPNYIVATPVVHQDRLYVGLGTHMEHPNGAPFSHVLCIDVTKTGNVSPQTLSHPDARNQGSALVWSYGGRVVPLPKKGRRVVFGRTLSTAAVHDNLVYVAEETGYLHCLDAATGRAYWVDDLKTGVLASPYWADGKVFLSTADGEMLIYAHGKQKRLEARIEVDECIHGTPAAAHGVLYVLTRSKLVAIARDR